MGGIALILLGVWGALIPFVVPPIVLVVGLLLCMPFLVLAQDETRVLSVLTFPLLAGYWLLNERALALAQRC